MYAVKVNNLLRHSINKKYFATVLIKNAENWNNCNIEQTLAVTVNMQSGPDSEVRLCHAKS